MKRVLLLWLITTGFVMAMPAFSQDKKSPGKKSKEIIIRSDGDVKKKMTIVVDGEDVTVNGKPLADFKEGDVKIIERNRIDRGSGNFLVTPDGSEWSMDMAPRMRSLRSSAFLGVVTEKADNGTRIREVVKESSAEKAGLKEGDIITKVDSKEIDDPEGLMDAISDRKPGDEITLNYTRDGKKSSSKIKLGEHKFGYANTFRFDNGDSDHFRNFEYNMPKIPEARSFPHVDRNVMRFFRTDRAKLGVKVEDTENEKGVKILDVTEGSPAAKAGLKKDDIVSEANGEKIENVQDLREQVMDTDDGEPVKLKVMRNNSEMNFNVTIPKPKNSADL